MAKNRRGVAPLVFQALFVVDYVTLDPYGSGTNQKWVRTPLRCRGTRRRRGVSLLVTRGPRAPTRHAATKLTFQNTRSPPFRCPRLPPPSGRHRAGGPCLAPDIARPGRSSRSIRARAQEEEHEQQETRSCPNSRLAISARCSRRRRPTLSPPCRPPSSPTSARARSITTSAT